MILHVHIQYNSTDWDLFKLYFIVCKNLYLRSSHCEITRNKAFVHHKQRAHLEYTYQAIILGFKTCNKY